MHCRKMCLHIDTGSTFIGRTDQNPLCSRPHFTKKGIPCSVSLGIMNKCNLIRRDTLLYKFCFQIIIHIKGICLCPRNGKHLFFPTGSWCTDIGKDKLCANDTLLLCFPVFIQHIFHYLIKLSIHIVRCIRHQQSCIRTEKPCLMCDL